ncbi:nuclear transport factor 2 family protein [Streptomyces tendae]|uniref:nuclear transport factor 2 family protein n=1 Tax=Streptomyces tendae TaxID=1932 RepID=UPI003691C89D
MSSIKVEKSAGDEATQNLLDIQAIRSLLDRYAFAMDRKDPELMRTCFTEDADLSYYGGLKRFNRDSFADQLLSGLEPFRTINHSVSSIQIVVEGDTAHGDMHIFATMMLKATPSVIVRGVHVVDEYERTADGWKVSNRRHAPFLQYEMPTTLIDFPGVGGINE